MRKKNFKTQILEDLLFLFFKALLIFILAIVISIILRNLVPLIPLIGLIIDLTEQVNIFIAKLFCATFLIAILLSIYAFSPKKFHRPRHLAAVGVLCVFIFYYCLYLAITKIGLLKQYTEVQMGLMANSTEGVFLQMNINNIADQEGIEIEIRGFRQNKSIPFEVYLGNFTLAIFEDYIPFLVEKKFSKDPLKDIWPKGIKNLECKENKGDNNWTICSYAEASGLNVTLEFYGSVKNVKAKINFTKMDLNKGSGYAFTVLFNENVKINASNDCAFRIYMAIPKLKKVLENSRKLHFSIQPYNNSNFDVALDLLLKNLRAASLSSYPEEICHLRSDTTKISSYTVISCNMRPYLFIDITNYPKIEQDFEESVDEALMVFVAAIIPILAAAIATRK